MVTRILVSLLALFAIFAVFTYSQVCVIDGKISTNGQTFTFQGPGNETYEAISCKCQGQITKINQCSFNTNGHVSVLSIEGISFQNAIEKAKLDNCYKNILITDPSGENYYGHQAYEWYPCQETLPEEVEIRGRDIYLPKNYFFNVKNGSDSRLITKEGTRKQDDLKLKDGEQLIIVKSTPVVMKNEMKLDFPFMERTITCEAGQCQLGEVQCAYTKPFAYPLSAISYPKMSSGGFEYQIKDGRPSFKRNNKGEIQKRLEKYYSYFTDKKYAKYDLCTDKIKNVQMAQRLATLLAYSGNPRMARCLEKIGYPTDVETVGERDLHHSQAPTHKKTGHGYHSWSQSEIKKDLDIVNRVCPLDPYPDSLAPKGTVKLSEESQAVAILHKTNFGADGRINTVFVKESKKEKWMPSTGITKINQNRASKVQIDWPISANWETKDLIINYLDSPGSNITKDKWFLDISNRATIEIPMKQNDFGSRRLLSVDRSKMEPAEFDNLLASMGKGEFAILSSKKPKMPETKWHEVELKEEIIERAKSLFIRERKSPLVCDQENDELFKLRKPLTSDSLEVKNKGIDDGQGNYLVAVREKYYEVIPKSSFCFKKNKFEWGFYWVLVGPNSGKILPDSSGFAPKYRADFDGDNQYEWVLTKGSKVLIL